MPALDVFSKAVSGAIEYIIIVAAGLVALPGRVIVYNRKRSKGNEDDIEQVRSHLDLDTEGPSRLDRHEERMAEIQRMNARQERYFVGDPDDPSTNGLLHDVHEIKAQVSKIEGDDESTADE